MKVLILTEGNKKIGFGHITRCLSLYEAFIEKNINPQLIINGDNSIRTLVNGIQYISFNWLKNKKKLFKIVLKSDILIIDSYLSDKNLCEQLSKTTKVILYVDDFNRLAYPKGFVLNAAIDSIDLPYPKSNNIKYLLGTKYALVRKKFQLAKKNKLKKNVNSILITLGGSDKRKLTFPIIMMIKKMLPNIIKNVIIDQSHADLKKIISLKNKLTHVYIRPTIAELVKMINTVDIAISAGGQTILELVKLGVPTIAIVVANNQELQVKSLYKLGAIEYSGNWKDKKLLIKLKKSIIRITKFQKRKEMIQKGIRLIDGKGPGRVIRILIKELSYIRKTEKINIRKIERKDSPSILHLSNEREVRKSSFISKKISLEDHKKWFSSKLSDSNTLFFVSDIGKSITGQIRAELSNNKALLSISVSKKYRKHHIGYNLVSYLINSIRSNKPKIKMIVAQMNVNNISSINFFKSLGFKYSKEIKVNGKKAKEFIYYL